MADPAKVGAIRLDPRSQDPAYAARARFTFYGDISDDRSAAIVNHLHCDEVASTAGQPIAASPIATAERQGSGCRDPFHLGVSLKHMQSTEAERIVDAAMAPARFDRRSVYENKTERLRFARESLPGSATIAGVDLTNQGTQAILPGKFAGVRLATVLMQCD